jgi:hypothetical protein
MAPIRALRSPARGSSRGRPVGRTAGKLVVPPQQGVPAENRRNWALVAALLAALATVVASIGGLFYNAQTIRQSTVQAQQADRAQASERFSRSVEQLGSTSEPVRIGALYAFGGLMRDSPRDQLSIVEILSSFVRLEADGRRLGQGLANDPPADVLAALRVLDSQPRPRSELTSNGDVVRWPSMMLSGVGLRNVNLSGTSLREADLEYAHFVHVEMLEIDLSGSNLRSTTWVRPSLVAATLASADLTFANLYRGGTHSSEPGGRSPGLHRPRRDGAR